jgi:hypothetical protein
MSGGKAPRRRRRPAIQVELPLPGPQGDLPPVEVPEPRWWQRPVVPMALAALAALLLALLVASWISTRQERARSAALEAEVHSLTLRAASREEAIRITPNPRSWSAGPDAVLQWPEPPAQLEIYLPVAYSDYRTFSVTMDKVGHGRVMVVHRITPDSNRELRLSLNSSALGPGEYRIRLQGYTWRGERMDAGWVRLIIAPAK